MAERETTVRSRELGEGLRAVMERATLAGKDIAHKLGWAPSDVSRLLNGKRGIRETDVARFLGACSVQGAEYERLMRLCREANKPGWWQQHGSRLPAQLRTYIDHEDKAAVISDFQANFLPGSLQTSDYARAVISSFATIPDDEVDERVAAQLARSNMFSRRSPAVFKYFLHEFALRLPVGGQSVMSDQLHHLLRLSVRPYIALRALPASVGAHAAITGSFTLMEFAQIKPVVYVESATHAVFLEEHAEIAAYRRILTSLDATALDAEQSRVLIRKLAVELYGDPEDDREPA